MGEFKLDAGKVWDLHWKWESESKNHPKPEDVPPGEVWVLTYRGCEAIGIRNSDAFAHYPWNIIGVPWGEVDPGFDAGVSLICRLTTEELP